MKQLLPFIFVPFLFSCVGSEKTAKELVDQTQGEVQIRLDRVVAMKSYNLYNQTLSNATGISLGDVKGEFERIKSSLPASNDISAFNEFNQIAIVRLSFAYCSRYVGDKFDPSGLSSAQIANHFVSSFIDFDSNHPGHQALLQEIALIIDNDSEQMRDLDGNILGTSRMIATSNNENNATAACTAFLSSSYFTAML